MQNRVIIVDPAFHGLNFIPVIKEQGLKLVILTTQPQLNSKKYNPDIADDILIVQDTQCLEQLKKAIDLYPQRNEILACLPGNDMVGALVAELAEYIDRPSLTALAVRRSCDKYLTRQALSESNIPSARYALIKSVADLDRAIERVGFPAIFKPVDCGVSFEVYRVNSADELRKVAKSSIAKIAEFSKHPTALNYKISGEYILEEYLEGPEFSVETHLRNSELKFIQITEKIVSSKNHYELGHIVPALLSRGDRAGIEEMTINALEAVGLSNGTHHTELRLTPNGPRVIEVNARPAGDGIASDLIKIASGVDLIKAHVNFFLGNNYDLQITNEKIAGIFFIPTPIKGSFSKAYISKSIKNHPLVKEIKIYRQPGDKADPNCAFFWRIGHLIVEHESQAQLNELGKELVHSIEVGIK